MRRTKPHEQLGHLQLQVMRVLWQRGTATLADVRAAIEPQQLATTTIATVLARLKHAGLVTYREGPPRVYSAAVAEEELQRTQARRLVDRLFGGRASDLVAHLVHEFDIDAGELARLRKLLQQRRRS